MVNAIVCFLITLFCCMISTSSLARGMVKGDTDYGGICYALGGASYSFKLITEIDGYLSPSESVGSVIGKVYFAGGNFHCDYTWVDIRGGGQMAIPTAFTPWSLYIEPNANTVGTGSICATGTEGLGITYYDDMGNALPCSGANVLIARIKGQKTTKNFPKRMIAKIIKTSEELRPGHYSLNISPTAYSEVSPPGERFGLRNWDLSVSGANDIFVPPRDFQIYFPEYPSGSPRVNLMLQKATPSSMEGIRTLSMCLYDGDDASSSRTTLTLMDEGSPAPGRPPGQFSVYRLGGDKTAQTDRVDYQVSIINPTTGAPEHVSQGNAIVWSGTDKRAVQQLVSLPGIPGLSHCLPAPLTLQTPAFGIGDKSAGRYSGQLKIIYRPSTT